MFGVRPDWVLIGSQDPQGGGVILMASRTLSQIDVRVEYDDEFATLQMGPFTQTIRTGSPRVEMELVMHDYAWVKAPDYGAAFENLQDLFREWDQRYRPQRVKLPETTTGLPTQPALPAPPSGRY